MSDQRVGDHDLNSKWKPELASSSSNLPRDKLRLRRIHIIEDGMNENPAKGTKFPLFGLCKTLFQVTMYVLEVCQGPVLKMVMLASLWMMMQPLVLVRGINCTESSAVRLPGLDHVNYIRMFDYQRHSHILLSMFMKPICEADIPEKTSMAPTRRA